MRIGVSIPYRRLRFQPTVMARDLATSVEVLSAAIHGVHTNRLDGSEAERLVGVRGWVSRETVSKITEQVLEEMDRLDELGRWMRGRLVNVVNVSSIFEGGVCELVE